MKHFARLVTLVALLGLHAAAQGRTWVVDRANGAGSHFATIQAAVDAAVDGDTILIRQGSYQEQVRIDAKALQVVSLSALLIGSSALTAAPLFEIVNLPANRECHLRSLTLLRVSGVAGSGLRVANSAGRVWVDSVFADNYDGAAIHVDNAREVLIMRSFAQANAAAVVQGVIRPSDGLVVENGSRVWLWDTTARGSHGPPLRGTPTVVIPGGRGALVRDSVVELLAADLNGGTGGSMLVGTCRHAAIGGVALEVISTTPGSSSVRVRGFGVSAGPTGWFDAGCAPDPGTAPAIVDPSGAVNARAGTARILDWPVTPYTNGAFEVLVRGVPRDLYFGLIALRSSAPVALPGIDGSVFLDFAQTILAYRGQLDGTGFGAFTDRWVSPIGTVHVHAQFVILDQMGALWLTNPGTITLR